MIAGSKNRDRQLAFELQNSHVCEKRSNHTLKQTTLKCKKYNKDAIFKVMGMFVDKNLNVTTKNIFLFSLCGEKEGKRRFRCLRST